VRCLRSSSSRSQPAARAHPSPVVIKCLRAHIFPTQNAHCSATKQQFERMWVSSGWKRHLTRQFKLFLFYSTAFLLTVYCERHFWLWWCSDHVTRVQNVYAAWCITRFLPSSKGIILKAAYKSKKDGRAFITRRVVQVASRHTLAVYRNCTCTQSKTLRNALCDYEMRP
jgi:hypothetical protein